MDTGLLTQAVLLFKEACAPWPALLAPIMESLLYDLILLAWGLWGLSIVFKFDMPDLLSNVFQFLLKCGFCVFGVRLGYLFIGNMFEGVKELAMLIGAPPLDPSSVAAMGGQVLKPMLKAMAESGWMSFASHPASSFFGVMAMFFLWFAFAIQAIMVTGVLLLSYFLTACAPFLLCFFVLPFTAGISAGYVRLCYSCFVGLFSCMLMTGISMTIGDLLGAQLAKQFAIPTASLSYMDFLEPLAVGIILCAAFVWIPYRIMRSVGGPDLQPAGGGGLRMVGQAALREMGSGGSSATKSVGSAGGGSSLGSSGGGAGFGTGGGSLQPVPARSGAWGRP